MDTQTLRSTIFDHLERSLSEKAWTIFNFAWSNSDRLLRSIEEISKLVLDEHGVDSNNVCIGVVGSIGRHEGLYTSDVDLLPIWGGASSAFSDFAIVMENLREKVRHELSIDVSTSRDLMRSTQVSELCEAESIGGDTDDRRRLTQRILLLTESSQAGGHLSLNTVRRKILEAYVGDEVSQRTASRHPMSVSNDIARYYRTVCMDYKSRAETRPENWCLRVCKLRGQRKFWYLATLFSISQAFEDSSELNHSQKIDLLAKVFEFPPMLRLCMAASDAEIVAIIECYIAYISELGEEDVRHALNLVIFDQRFEDLLPDGVTQNPFPSLYQQSKRLHEKMLEALVLAEPSIRKRALDWFLL